VRAACDSRNHFPNPHVRNGYLRERFRLGRFHGLATGSFVFTFRQATLDHVCFHAVPKSPVFTRSEARSAQKCSFLRADLGHFLSTGGIVTNGAKIKVGLFLRKVWEQNLNVSQ